VNILARAVALSSVTMISACSSGMSAIFSTAQHAIQSNRGLANVRLNPDFRYLRITIDGRLALVALGEVDDHPQGPIEVWFSAEREVLRFQNGRLVGATGLTTEWRNVSVPKIPEWSDLARSEQPFIWTRVRDVMPGYRFGVEDRLILQPVSAPRQSALQRIDPQNLAWFEERSDSSGKGVLAQELNLPPARYAVDLSDGNGTVVYGEQCLAATLCFTWQRWRAEFQGLAGR
jgi:hypothetical protein